MGIDADASIYAHTAEQNTSTNICPKCATELSPAAYGAARRWGHCKACKPWPPLVLTRDVRRQRPPEWTEAEANERIARQLERLAERMQTT